MILKYQNVYIHSYGCAVQKNISESLNKERLDTIFEDDLCQENSFEKGERNCIRKACDAALRKGKLHVSDLQFAIGADLNPQLSASHYFMKDYEIPFVGMYAACASSSLLIHQASLLLSQSDYVLAFTSSNYGVAARVFRYPNTYGEQKKETVTTTVTGAGAIILSHQPSYICVKEGFIGKIVDWHYDNVADMGGAMAPAVYQNLKEYLLESEYDIDDFDCIASGDLSKVGFSMLESLLKEDGYEVDQRFMDCGLHVFDIQHQNVFCGGSGPACSMVVLISELFDRIEKGEYQRVLLLASGALFSPIPLYQKESIPCICHGIVFERSSI